MSKRPRLSSGCPEHGLTVGEYSRELSIGGAAVVCAGAWLGRAGRLKEDTPSMCGEGWGAPLAR